MRNFFIVVIACGALVLIIIICGIVYCVKSKQKASEMKT